MAGAQGGWGEGADAMARQVWETWGEALRKFASVPLETAAPAWQQVPGGWPGWTPPKGGAPGDVMERFDGLARHWFGRMQHVAAQFADRDNTPADIVAAWRQALGATEAKPYPDLFGSLFGQATGLDDLGEQWLPWLESLRGPLEEWSRTPAFGPAREHQQRWKGLLQAQHALREAAEAYRTLLEDASRQAYALFEEKLNLRAGEGSALDSARALFDEWIDAAEDAYARMALSEEFSEVYGALANAQMRMRAGVQREVEQLGSLLGLPTRTEVDAAHRKIAELERILRRMQRGQAAERPAPRPSPAPEAQPQGPAPARPAKAAKRPAASKPSAASKAPAKRAARAAAKKNPSTAAAKQNAAKQAGRTTAPGKPTAKSSAKRAKRGKATA